MAFGFTGWIVSPRQDVSTFFSVVSGVKQKKRRVSYPINSIFCESPHPTFPNSFAVVGVFHIVLKDGDLTIACGTPEINFASALEGEY